MNYRKRVCGSWNWKASLGQRDRQRGMVTAEIAFASIGAALATVGLAWVLVVLATMLEMAGAQFWSEQGLPEHRDSPLCPM